MLGSFVANKLKCRLLHSCLNVEVIFSFKISGEGIENGAIVESSFNCIQPVSIRNDVMFDSFRCII